MERAGHAIDQDELGFSDLSAGCGSSPLWKQKVGEGRSVNWPAGVDGKGNVGVASYVQRIGDSIGHVECAYALQNKLIYLQVKNRDGTFVVPAIESFTAAAAGAQWDDAPGMYLILTDQAGANSWPVSGAIFIFVQKAQERPERAPSPEPSRC